VRVHEVRERPLPVDLDHGEIPSIARLELPVSADVHEREVEREFLLNRAHDLERPLAEVAVLGVVQRYPRGGYG